ncbi:FGGY carbohydrate kinase domain-containing protein-like isoform X2 [Varroa jacobsoni]|uniref:FGGY carbohydrate kinase domain-containing protein n=1 Tax=Varroa destructor TaxID=109461 RepID=A0A7M7MED7_VARDE|nr:FGGY carbohydrate kinase domain-containing protein-like isoform X2 [Varroa destructor]XP_022708588.1 FGGY carbohydrate kinase domain-containing protein-like isoform X2 [Varroa jacobsoni]
MATSFVVGVDVGSRSARAALVTLRGNLVRKADRPLEVREQKGEIFEQNADQIWNAICECVREVVSSVSVDDIKGRPVSVSADGDDRFNVIMWCDHRARDEAELINRGGYQVLRRVGGRISPEMEPPRLLWLKRHMPHSFQRIKHAFDLPDYLTYRATGSLSRSLCSLTCKWTYDAQKGWDKAFWREIGLEEIADNPEIIGKQNEVRYPGDFLGTLSKNAVKDLGLSSQTKVGASVIDAHAGVLGMLGAFAKGVSSEPTTRLCLIAGTSTCHMLLSKKEIFVNGVWGPYEGAIFPNLYLAEAGQSASGMFLDHLLMTHSRYNEALENSKRFGLHIVEFVTQILENMASSNRCSVDELTKDLHVYPDYHGNRSPLADPNMRGMISGLELSNTEEDLAILFLAGVQALAYQTKQIVDQLEKQGHRVESLLLCGGLINNPLYVAAHANVLQRPVLVPDENEVVLIGAAVLAARALGCFQDLWESMREMSGRATIRWPDQAVAELHSRRYKAFLILLDCQLAIRKVMNPIERASAY